MRKKTALIAIAAAAALSAPAAAETLVLYDYSAAFGIDAGSDAYVDQKIQHQISFNLLTPMRVPIADGDKPLTARLQIVGGGAPFTRPGTQIQSGTIFWLVTTAREKGMIRWQVEINRASAYVGGAMPPSDVRLTTQTVGGRAIAGASPALRATYQMDGRTHVLTGYVQP